MTDPNNVSPPINPLEQLPSIQVFMLDGSKMIFEYQPGEVTYAMDWFVGNGKGHNDKTCLVVHHYPIGGKQKNIAIPFTSIHHIEIDTEITG